MAFWLIGKMTTYFPIRNFRTCLRGIYGAGGFSGLLRGGGGFRVEFFY